MGRKIDIISKCGNVDVFACFLVYDPQKDQSLMLVLKAVLDVEMLIWILAKVAFICRFLSDFPWILTCNYLPVLRFTHSDISEV